MLPKSVEEPLNTLASAIRGTEEYRVLSEARENAESNDTVKALLKEYRHLEFRARTAQLNGETDNEAMRKLEAVGTLLHDDPDGSALLFAEYRMNTLMAELYKRLADTAGTDLGIFED